MEEDMITEVLRRICKLEEHIINLIIPIQGIVTCMKNPSVQKDLIDLLKYPKPFPIDSSELKIILEDFKRAMNAFSNSIRELKDFNSSSAFGELKYIGKRLNELEKSVKNIEKDGQIKSIKLDFSCDGYQFVKKPVGYDPQDPIEDSSDENIKRLLNTISSREAEAIIHRLGLFGEKAKTYEKIGKVLNVHGERARQIYAKAIRRCRCPSRKEFVDKITDEKLKKEITSSSC